MKIFIYKEFNDDRACGEEFIKLFANKEEAITFLKEHVRRDYGDDPRVLMHDPEFADDCFKDDYVSIQNDSGDTNVYIIEEHEFNPTRIEIPVHDNVKLVAERDPDVDMKGIYIGVENDDTWQQDLALVRVPYHIDGDRYVLDPGTYEVLVWGYEWDEDYTDRFKVAEWSDPEKGERHDDKNI